MNAASIFPSFNGKRESAPLLRADACRGVGRTLSSFTYAGPLTETVLLGSIAIRMPGETLRWDSAGLRFTNVSAANLLLKKTYRQGWEPSWVS